jgi:hypothetical protein
MAEKTKLVDMTMEKMEQFRKAATDFRDSVVSRVKDMQAEVKNWHFGMESSEEGVVVDVSVKLLIKPKKSGTA